MCFTAGSTHTLKYRLLLSLQYQCPDAEITLSVCKNVEAKQIPIRLY